MDVGVNDRYRAALCAQIQRRGTGGKPQKCPAIHMTLLAHNFNKSPQMKRADVLMTKRTIYTGYREGAIVWVEQPSARCVERGIDRKSTRLNSSHLGISYAV